MASEYQPGDLRNTPALYDDLIGDPTGFSPLNQQAHGSSAHRWASFIQGYNSGHSGE